MSSPANNVSGGAAASAPVALVLVNLEAGDSFLFNLFPENIELSGRANWRPQNVTHGLQPLLYANREPQQLRFPSLWLDNTRGRDSLNAELVQLLALQERAKGKGAPPALLARWGDASFRGVLTEVNIRETYFTREGNPLRAELSLTLLELQDEIAPVSSPQQPAQQSTPLTGQVITSGKGPQP
ncbi:MAG TPA: hypothetical protein VIP46_22530 [Pyrinomonadaceae bacterium]